MDYPAGAAGREVAWIKFMDFRSLPWHQGWIIGGYCGCAGEFVRILRI
jgi:hypothetical protein